MNLPVNHSNLTFSPPKKKIKNEALVYFFHTRQSSWSLWAEHKSWQHDLKVCGLFRCNVYFTLSENHGIILIPSSHLLVRHLIILLILRKIEEEKQEYNITNLPIYHKNKNWHEEFEAFLFAGIILRIKSDSEFDNGLQYVVWDNFLLRGLVVLFVNILLCDWIVKGKIKLP